MNQPVNNNVIPSTEPKALMDDDIIDLRKLFQTLWHHKWAIFGFTLAATLLTVLIVFSLTPKYQATAVRGLGLINVHNHNIKTILSD